MWLWLRNQLKDQIENLLIGSPLIIPSLQSIEELIRWFHKSRNYVQIYEYFLSNWFFFLFLCTMNVNNDIQYRRFIMSSEEIFYIGLYRDWSPKFATGLNMIIGCSSKINEWSNYPFAKMIPSRKNHFGKITAWALI